MKTKLILLVFLSLIYFGCADLFWEKQEIIIGNISVINPHNQEDKGYKLVMNEGEFNSNILENYVTDISGDDSVLLVRGLSKESCEEVFYKIRHNIGEKPIFVADIDEVSYTKNVKDFKSKYRFHTGLPQCP